MCLILAIRHLHRLAQRHVAGLALPLVAVISGPGPEMSIADAR
jgi:hypothetical protein